MPLDYRAPQLLLASPMGDARPNRKRLSRACFNLIHSRNLIYNTCWEDPRIGRMALNLGADDTMLTITSAGCNVLDYALLDPRQIYAVDINYRQNALLELKLAAIKALEFDTFFNLFGDGHLPNYCSTYRGQLALCSRPWPNPIGTATSITSRARDGNAAFTFMALPGSLPVSSPCM